MTQFQRQSIKINIKIFLPFDETIASKAVFVIVFGAERWTEMLLEPAK